MGFLVIGQAIALEQPAREFDHRAHARGDDNMARLFGDFLEFHVVSPPSTHGALVADALPHAAGPPRRPANHRGLSVILGSKSVKYARS